MHRGRMKNFTQLVRLEGSWWMDERESARIPAQVSRALLGTYSSVGSVTLKIVVRGGRFGVLGVGGGVEAELGSTIGWES